MPASILQKFSSHLRQTLKNSFKVAWELRHREITPLHLLYGLLGQKGAVGAEILSKNKVEKERIVQILSNLKKDVSEKLPEINEETQRILTKTALAAAENQHRYIGTEHLLLALLESSSVSLNEFFKSQKIDLEILKQTALNVLSSADRFPDLASLLEIPVEEKEEKIKTASTLLKKRPSKKTPALNFFTIDLTSPKSQKELDPVIGRKNEINRLIQILCRRTKNNPVLLGDPGVGKTAIVEGLAQKIVAGEVADELQGKKIRRLDLGLLVAGTIYRGEFESRLKQLLDEIKADPEIILFIDELHTIVGAGSASGSLDAANLLKPALARGEIRCIGATTFEEFKKHIESDAALERRFQPIIVNEPTTEETIAILQGLKANYEKYHLVKISDEAIKAAVDLAERYRPDKFFPDKAIDLLDEAAAAKKLTSKSSGILKELKKKEKEQHALQEEKEQAVLNENFEKAVQLKEDEAALNKAIDELEQKIDRQKTKRQILLAAKDVAAIIAAATDLPMADLLEEEKNHLLDLENEIKKRLVGQDEAVEAAAQALRRARLGLADPRRPLASFLLAGPSGVGKTYLAKILAELFFHDKEAFIRLDMSEFSEGFQISKLIGSPAGYVGYKEGNKFTDKVKSRPYSVILFDEIDKAHPDVFHLLLQILDEGHLTDAVGKKINFKNTVIIMTSNHGQEHFSAVSLGFAEDKKAGVLDKKQFESIKNSVIKDLKNHFRSEFLNRLDSILVLRPLSLADLEKIAALQIADLNQRLVQKKIFLDLTPAAARLLSQKAVELEQGARAIAKVIQKEIEEPLTNWLLQHPATAQKIIKISCRQKNLWLDL